MARFKYAAYDKAGNRREGDLLVPDITAAKSKIRELDLIPVEIRKAEEKEEDSRFFFFKRGVTPAEVEFFTAQMHILLKNGIKIDRALEITKKEIRNKKFLKLITDIHQRVRRGDSLSQSLAHYPQLFDSLYVSLLAVGEATGDMPRVFGDIARNLKFSRQIIGRTKQAMIYPSLVAAVCFLSILFLFNFIVPKFTVIFENAVNVPVYTRALLGISVFFRRYQLLMITGLLGAVLALFRMAKTKATSSLFSELMVRMPGVRGLAMNLSRLRFSSAMAILLSRGILLVNAVELAVQAINNRVIERRLLNVKTDVNQGISLSRALDKSGFLPPSFMGMLEAGEETGRLGDVFMEMEERFREDYEKAIAGMIGLLEPIMILIMGLVVGSIVVVMLLSMVSINDIGL